MSLTGGVSVNTLAQNYMQKQLVEAQAERKIDNFRPGDLICVHVLIQDGNKERLQKFEGRCVARRGGGTDATYTVWSVIGEVGVRRIFPLYAYDVTLIRRGKVRRAKLNYFTKLRGKAARIKERGRKV